MEGFAIKVENVSKEFKLPHEKNTSIKSAVINLFRSNKGYELQRALNDVSFEIKQGEFFGIVGRNGSGKSTLLKLLAGIYYPTKGSITVNGKLTPFIELGVGFNPELTGRENVFLNGALLGFNRKEMQKMYKDIVSFAELGKFMDQKLKNYSSGMQVRLAFSIAIRAQSDILLIDEVLAVGDAAFQQKCFDYFRQLKKQGRTVVFVSHDMASVKEFCDRALLIMDGELQYVGDTNDVASRYLLASASGPESEEYKDQKADPHFEFLNVELDKSSGTYKSDETIRFTINYKIKKKLNYDIGISILKNGVSLFEKNTKRLDLPESPGTHHLSWSAPAGSFLEDVYKLNVAAFTKPKFELIAFVNNAASFYVEGKKGGGLAHIDSSWKVKDN
jgi:ABC-2 type transport system ATP-binding protein